MVLCTWRNQSTNVIQEPGTAPYISDKQNRAAQNGHHSQTIFLPEIDNVWNVNKISSKYFPVSLNGDMLALDRTVSICRQEL